MSYIYAFIFIRRYKVNDCGMYTTLIKQIYVSKIYLVTYYMINNNLCKIESDGKRILIYIIIIYFNEQKNKLKSPLLYILSELIDESSSPDIYSFI